MPIKDDFNEIRQAAKMMNEQLAILKDLNDTNISTGYGLDLRVRDALDRLSYDKIPEMDEADVLRFLRDNGEGDSNIDALKEVQQNSESESEWKNKSFEEYCKHVLVAIKDSLMQIRKLEKDKNDLSKKMESMEDDYFSYVNTTEYKEKNRQRIQEMKQKAEEETDELKKASILRDLEYMENADTLKFLTERLDSNGQKEVDNIASTYFDHTRSSHVMKKFSVRMPRFGYNKDIYKFFFNLEETFLPEEYHAFNNLFLFHVMRAISYMDADIKRDQLYVSAILVRLYNLIYHKFGDQEQENAFIDFIKNIDDRFREKWYDKFEKDNVTQPKHPDRIAMENKAEEKRRIKTIAELQNHGIEPDTTLETSELVDQLKKVIEDEKAQRDAELEKWEAEHPTKEETTEDTTEESVDDSEETSSEAAKDTPDEVHDGTGSEVTIVSDTDNVTVDSYSITTEDVSETETSTNEDTIEQEPVIDMNNPEEVLDAINASKDFDKFDEDISSMGDELRQEMNRDNADGVIEDTHNTVAVEVYVDVHGYYYRLMEDGTYTYFSNKDTVYETDISEDTILKLANTGNLQKITRIFNA